MYGRTKTKEECRAQAMIMGGNWVYHSDMHMYSNLLSDGHGSPLEFEYLCAETLKPLDAREVEYRTLYYRAMEVRRQSDAEDRAEEVTGAG